MAVYTEITRDALETFLGGYDGIGALQSFEGIAQGVENTNYHVFTDKARYVLTLFEQRVNPIDLPFFIAFTDHLARKGIICPQTLLDREADAVGRIADRPAILSTFLSGQTTPEEDITPDHCREMGALTARLHLAAQDFNQRRDNTMGLSAWRDLAAKTAARADEAGEGVAALIADELAFQARQNFSALPKAVIHADLFPDNVFFDGSELSGVIDFYFSCTGYLMYDLALVINAWCFDTQGQLQPRRLKALLDAYKQLRPFERGETESLSLFCRAAALRILLTRLHDWLFHDPAALVTPKSPQEYIARLRFHRQLVVTFS